MRKNALLAQAAIAFLFAFFQATNNSRKNSFAFVLNFCSEYFSSSCLYIYVFEKSRKSLLIAQQTESCRNLFKTTHFSVMLCVANFYTRFILVLPNKLQKMYHKNERKTFRDILLFWFILFFFFSPGLTKCLCVYEFIDRIFSCSQLLKHLCILHIKRIVAWCLCVTHVDFFHSARFSAFPSFCT